MEIFDCYKISAINLLFDLLLCFTWTNKNLKEASLMIQCVQPVLMEIDWKRLIV